MAKRRKRKKPSESTPDFAVTARVKEYIRQKGMRSDGDLVAELNVVIEETLDNAVMRAEDNGRATVRPGDL